MTSTSDRSGMPGHFGIRITGADKDKLVGELDADDRHLNNSGHVHGGAVQLAGEEHAAFPVFAPFETARLFRGAAASGVSKRASSG